MHLNGWQRLWLVASIVWAVVVLLLAGILQSDGINIASRIHGFAAPGEIVVTALTRELIANRLPIDIVRLPDGVEVEDGMLVLKREVYPEGRSRAWVNGSPATAGARIPPRTPSRGASPTSRSRPDVAATAKSCHDYFAYLLLDFATVEKR